MMILSRVDIKFSIVYVIESGIKIVVLIGGWILLLGINEVDVLFVSCIIELLWFFS